MDDVQVLPSVAEAVGVVEPQRHLLGDVRRHLGGHRAACGAQLAEDAEQVLAAHVLHGQEVAAVDLTEVVDLDDVRVVEEALMRASLMNISTNSGVVLLSFRMR